MPTEITSYICYNTASGAKDHVTQLIEFIAETSNNMASGKQTDVLIMDFSKAFDKVSHSLLVHKLEHYGIRGKNNNWIKQTSYTIDHRRC
jgi:hypothetical protein